MGPYYYKVNRIDGDYAYLMRTDITDNEEMIVARALLPQDIDVNTNLKWENLVYTILDQFFRQSRKSVRYNLVY